MERGRRSKSLISRRQGSLTILISWTRNVSSLSTCFPPYRPRIGSTHAICRSISKSVATSTTKPSFERWKITRLTLMPTMRFSLRPASVPKSLCSVQSRASLTLATAVNCTTQWILCQGMQESSLSTCSWVPAVPQNPSTPWFNHRSSENLSRNFRRRHLLASIEVQIRVLHWKSHRVDQWSLAPTVS